MFEMVDRRGRGALDVNERCYGWLTTASALLTSLAGGPWWAVLLGVLTVMGMTYGTVYLLAVRPNPPMTIKTFLITCTWASDGQQHTGLNTSQSEPESQARNGQPSR